MIQFAFDRAVRRATNFASRLIRRYAKKVGSKKDEVSSENGSERNRGSKK
jgi:hypothetical protein